VRLWSLKFREAPGCASETSSPSSGMGRSEFEVALTGLRERATAGADAEGISAGACLGRARSWSSSSIARDIAEVMQSGLLEVPRMLGRS